MFLDTAQFDREARLFPSRSTHCEGRSHVPHAVDSLSIFVSLHAHHMELALPICNMPSSSRLPSCCALSATMQLPFALVDERQRVSLPLVAGNLVGALR